MILTAAPTSIARLRRARFAALALLGLVIGHDAVYLAMFGPTYHEAMARSGHGYWLSFALIAMVVAGVPLVAALLTLRRLRSAVAQRGSGSGDGSSPIAASAMASFQATTLEFVATTPRLFLVIATGFAVQENLEHVVAGHAAPGLFVLAPPLVLPVLFGIAGLLALAGTWLRWREAVLRARLAAVEAAEAVRRMLGSESAHARWAEVGARIASEWLTRRRAVRAPPGRVAA